MKLLLAALVVLAGVPAFAQTQPAYDEYVRFMQNKKEIRTGKATIFTYSQWVQYCRGEFTGQVVKVGRGKDRRTCRNFVNPPPDHAVANNLPGPPPRQIVQSPRPPVKGSRNLNVTFHSDPEGATLYANNDNHLFGYAPVRLKYNPEKQFRDGTGCMRLQGALVRWASGVEMSIGSLDACPENGGEQQFVFKRPDDVPGREIDVMFALEQQRLALLSEQVAATQRAAYWQSLSAQYAAQIERNRQIRLRMNCTSNVVGSYVYTNCY